MFYTPATDDADLSAGRPDGRQVVGGRSERLRAGAVADRSVGSVPGQALTRV